VREGLQRAFGFNRDLCDLFILYLAKGLGYRVLRNGKPVDLTQVDFGRLAGVTLERGQVLQLPEWTRAKEMARTWGVQAPVPDLSVGAQDQLWALLNTQAAVVAQRLEQIEIRLQALLEKVGASPEDSRRRHVLQAARALNSLAAPRGPDSYAGLKALLDWKAEEGVDLKEVTEAIVGRDDLHRDLHELPDETVNLVMKIAHSEDARAERLCERLREFLCASESEKDLSTAVRAWRRDASNLIEDRALGRDDETVKLNETDDGGGIGEKPGDYDLQDVVLKIGGEPVDVEARGVGEALLHILQKVETLKLDDVIEVLVQLRVKRK